MTFDMSEGSVDRLAFELWRDLDQPLMDLRTRLAGHQGVHIYSNLIANEYYLLDQRIEQKHCLPHKNPSALTDVHDYLRDALEFVDQNAPYGGLFRLHSVMLSSYSGKVLSLYLMDNGKGFPLDDGSGMEEAVQQEGKVFHFAQYARQYFSFSGGHVISARGGFRRNFEYKEMSWPFEVVPAGTLHCARFNLSKKKKKHKKRK